MKSEFALVTLIVVAAATACASSPEREAAWTPASSDLVFTSNRDGNSEIYLLRAGQTEWINLTNHPSGDNWPVWSPDGTRIAFQRRHDDKFDIFVMNADGSESQQLTDDPDHDYLPAWSVDGTKIYFLSWRQEADDTERIPHFYVMNADGSDERRLWSLSPYASADLRWSKDGTFAVTSLALESDNADVYVLDRAGRIVRRITWDSWNFDGAPSLSPDGKHIAYYSANDEGSDIVVVGVDAYGSRTLVSGGQAWYAEWSPDGRWIAYTVEVPEGPNDDLDVVAVPADGSGAPIVLAGGPTRESEGRWRPRR